MSKKPLGRPKKNLDWKRVDELLSFGCLGTEIAAEFDMHPVTFYEKVVEEFKVTFTEYSGQKKAKGECQLREAQHLKALSGDNSMLIWLGKNRLKQRDADKQETISPNDNQLADIHSQLKENKQLKDEIERLKQELAIFTTD